jgi:hypothetical protein
MHTFTKPLKLIMTLLMSFVFFASNTFADTSSDTCLDGINLVCITETFSHIESNTSGQVFNISKYSITNNSDAQIFAFAVTNTGARQAFIEQAFTGWHAFTSDQVTWDKTQKALNFDAATGVTKNWATGTTDLTAYNEIGSFVSLFGSAKSDTGQTLYANIYWNSSGSNALTTGKTFSSFYFNGLPESNFVAFDINGAIIASSLTTSISPPSIPDGSVAAVPEPETYLLFLAGLGLLAFQFRESKIISNTKNPIVKF